MISIKNLTKRYQYKKVINNIDMTFPDYGLIAIIGPSGCGKSTLLHIIGGIDKKYQGNISIDNKPISSFLKRKSIGFLFQSFHLITWLNTFYNIQLPLYYRNKKYIINSRGLDIDQCYSQKIYELSLGQRQRVAFLRTLIFNPRILLCDEPTASLDEENSLQIMKLLKEESKKRLIIYISHDLKLVEEYSDEIYLLQDGSIDKHIVKNKIEYRSDVKDSRSMKKPKIQLSFFSMKDNKTRFIQLCVSLILSFTSVLLSLSLGDGFHKQLNTYINSLVPQSSISFRFKNHSSIDLDDFCNEPFINHIHYYPKEYELLGIGEIKERYSKSDCVGIYDDSGYIENSQLLCGRLMKSISEIVVSKNTAIRFLGSNKIEELLDKDVMIWFKYRNEVKGKVVRIVGISQGNMESIYYYDNHFSIIEDIYKVKEITTHYGILYVDDVVNSLDILSNKYKQYEFKYVGENTKVQIDGFMNKAKIVLILFTMFAVISSVFLVGEVMFLEVMMKRKDIAIMKCFGASHFDIICFILYQFLFVFFTSMCISILLFIVFSYLLNHFLVQELLIHMNLIVIDYKLIIKVLIISFGYCLIIMFIPMIYALRLNTSDSLKIKS